MWQVFFQNLWNKHIRGGILLPALLLFTQIAYAEEVGLFERFNDIIQSQDKAFAKLEAEAENNSFAVGDLKSFEDITLNTTFINFLMLNTPLRYQHFLTRDECSIYDLMITDLIELPERYRSTVFFDYIDKKGNVKTTSLPKSRFFKELVSQKCPGVIKISRNFDTANLSMTLKNLSMKFPQNKPLCEQYFEKFRKDVTSPYLCHLVENIEKLPRWEAQARSISNKNKIAFRRELQTKIARAQKYKEVLTPEAFEKINKTCSYLDNIKIGCNEIFLDNYWTYLYREKSSSPIMKTYCADKINAKCLANLSKETYYCTEMIHKSNALTPAPTCKELQKTIKNSRLKMEYSDCPGKVGLESAVTFSRILKHFGFYQNDTIKDCSMNGIDPTAAFLKEFTELDQWNLQICYDDKINRKEVCQPVIFGELGDRDYSLSHVIGKVANKLRGYNYQETPCEIVDEEDYKPALLKFKNGCFIIKEKRYCRATNCNFKVIISERIFDNYTVKNNLKLNLFPFNYVKEKESLIKLLENNKKIKVDSIPNVTRFKSVFEAHPDAIFVGEGCIEDLYPIKYKRMRANQCRPVSFIVDYIYEAKGTFAMQIRTALDHVHAPRIVPWFYVFSSLKEYQLAHPINLWSFRALYQ